MYKISVIIPIYNMEKYIQECMDSVCSQTIYSDMEVICIDDGSTDQTLEILEKYRRTYENIIILQQKNSGAGVARNLGLAVAKGEFVHFIDADDLYYSENALESLYLTAKRENVAVCGGSMLLYDEGRTYYPRRFNVAEEWCFFSDQKIKFAEYQNVDVFSRYIYNRFFLERNHLKFPEVRYFEDPPFLLNVLIKAEYFYAIEENVYVHRNADKIYDYTEFLLQDTLVVLNEMLDVALKYDLCKTHNCILHWVEKYVYSICKFIADGNDKLDYMLSDLLRRFNKYYFEKEQETLFDEIMYLYENRYKLKDWIFEINKKISQIMKGYNDLIIYGAADLQRRFYYYLKEQHSGNIFFAVSAKDVSGMACGQQIHCIDELTDMKESALLLITASEKNYSEMIKNAENLGFANVFSMPRKKIKLLVD